MGCCGSQRRRFLTNVRKAKVDPRPLTEISDSELTPRQIRIKNRMNRIARRNRRAKERIAKQDRKTLDN